MPEVVEVGEPASQNHIGVIRTGLPPPVADWLDACCWSCGSEDVQLAGGPLLCGPCRLELDSDPSPDPVHVARHAYWERHALGCCWRCMVGAVDPDDDVGLCRSCLGQMGVPEEGRTARGPSRPPGVGPLSTTRRT